MTLADLMNNHYTREVREAMLDLILGRSDKVVRVGDVVEMLLSISFAVNDAMLDWEWLGIETPPVLETQLYSFLGIFADLLEHFFGLQTQPRT